MLMTVLKTFGFIFLMLILAVILGSMIHTLRCIITGRYLNRYYVVSYKGSGIYELHFAPAFGFYYAKPGKFFSIQEAAIEKFTSGYPDTTLYAETSTLQEYYERQGIPAIPIQKSLLAWMLGNYMSYFFILTNLANYRKRNINEWQVGHLMRRVHQTIPFRYIITGGLEVSRLSPNEKNNSDQ